MESTISKKQNHGTAMSTYSSFLSNIIMAAYIETQSLSKTVFKFLTNCLKTLDDIFPYGT